MSLKTNRIEYYMKILSYIFMENWAFHWFKTITHRGFDVKEWKTKKNPADLFCSLSSFYDERKNHKNT